MISSEQVIRSLQLEPLMEEGGFFREVYRSTVWSERPGRCCGTSIYYLLRGVELSCWHRLTTDEIWYYHGGSPAIQMLLFADGTWTERVIGAELSLGQVPQSLIPAGTWQAAVLMDRTKNSWGLFGAAVFPGFDYDDFSVADGLKLCSEYPDAAGRMRELGLI